MKLTPRRQDTKKNGPRARRIGLVWGITGLLVLGCLFVAATAARKPAGCFDSTSLLGHHASDDVVEFSDGKVTWRSCCGSVPAGRFFQLPDGVWVWVYTKEYRRKATNDSYDAEFIVRPSVLGLRVVSRTNAGEVYLLKRRLGRPKEIGVGKR